MTATATKTDGTKILPAENALQHNKNESPDSPLGISSPKESLDVGKLQDKLAKDLVRIFKLLSDETRLRILYSLSQAEELHRPALAH